MGRSMDRQQMSVCPAFVEADSSLGVTNQFVLRFLQLEVFHVELFINGTCIKNKLMGRDCKKGASQLPDARLVKIAIGNPPLLPIPW